MVMALAWLYTYTQTVSFSFLFWIIAKLSILSHWQCVLFGIFCFNDDNDLLHDMEFYFDLPLHTFVLFSFV